MVWLDPWWSTGDCDEQFHVVWRRQFVLEMCPDDPIHGIPVKVIGRGNGDDAVFELLDGSHRVCFVHLQWAKVKDCGRWRTAFRTLPTIDAFAEQVMRRDHEEWLANQD